MVGSHLENGNRQVAQAVRWVLREVSHRYLDEIAAYVVEHRAHVQGSFCTITSSSLGAIAVGSTVVYARAVDAPAHQLNSNIVLDAGAGNTKTWIHDGDVLGGIYTFRDQASIDAYAAGPIVTSMMSDPALSEFRLEQYDVLEKLSAITRGLPAAVVA